VVGWGRRAVGTLPIPTRSLRGQSLMCRTGVLLILGCSFISLGLGIGGVFDMQQAFLGSHSMLEPVARTGVFLLIAIGCVIGAAEAFLFSLPGK
jgi:hypothetical protein